MYSNGVSLVFEGATNTDPGTITIGSELSPIPLSPKFLLLKPSVYLFIEYGMLVACDVEGQQILCALPLQANQLNLTCDLNHPQSQFSHSKAIGPIFEQLHQLLPNAFSEIEAGLLGKKIEDYQLLQTFINRSRCFYALKDRELHMALLYQLNYQPINVYTSSAQRRHDISTYKSLKFKSEIEYQSNIIHIIDVGSFSLSAIHDFEKYCSTHGAMRIYFGEANDQIWIGPGLIARGEHWYFCNHTSEKEHLKAVNCIEGIGPVKTQPITTLGLNLVLSMLQYELMFYHRLLLNKSLTDESLTLRKVHSVLRGAQTQKNPLHIMRSACSKCVYEQVLVGDEII